MIRLIVQADDLGACGAMTAGILRCHRAGVITQASVIVPGPDAGRAMWLARRQGLPLGVHLALMCEWTGLRWGPLTRADSLRDTDGAMFSDFDDLCAKAHPAEAERELAAQLTFARQMGVDIRHFESHVREYSPVILARLSERFGLPSRDPLPAPGMTMALDSLWHLSTQPAEHKADNLLEHVASLRSGHHMIVTHPADDDPELTRLCPPESRRWKWARDIRLSDTAALLDPRFARLCHNRGVRLGTDG
jgi:predicted glycoside hydrolase/deacetylase ChbG (UPF0249 family)